MTAPKLTGLRKAAKGCGIPYTSLLHYLKSDEALRAATLRVGERLFVDEAGFARWIESKRLGGCMRKAPVPEMKNPAWPRDSSNHQTSTVCMHQNNITKHKKEVSAAPVNSLRKILDEVDRREAAKLAYVDAVLTAERMPPRFRSLRSDEITPISAPWPEFLIDVALFAGVDAVLANRGAFLIAERVWVCHQDELRRGIESGWHRIRLPSVDGRARIEDLRAPCILVSPDETCFIWRPFDDLRKQRRVNFVELCGLLNNMAERLARFKETA